MSICLIVLLVGILLCFWAPVVQFVLGLSVTAMAGAALALVMGSSPWAVLGWTAALFASAQVGYGLGVGAILVFRSSRARAPRGIRLPRPHAPFWK